MIGFNFSPALWAVALLGVLASGFWLVDSIGDIREAKVHARYAEAAQLTNEDIAAFTSEDEKVAAVADAMRGKALAEARGVLGDKHPASKQQAEALNRIR